MYPSDLSDAEWSVIKPLIIFKRRNAIFADNGHTISKDSAKRGAKGYDGWKKIKGRKRAIIFDKLGLIHTVHVVLQMSMTQNWLSLPL